MQHENYWPKDGPIMSQRSMARAKLRKSQHQLLNIKQGHQTGSQSYSTGQTKRVPYVNTRHNPVGYFNKK